MCKCGGYKKNQEEVIMDIIKEYGVIQLMN